jgi:hypothetical protein
MMASNKQDGFSIPDVGNIDAGRIGSMYGLKNPKDKDNSEPEYLEFSKRGRDIFGRLNFNTGLSWASGFTIAGLYGLQEGWRNAPSNNFRVKFNSVLNGISKRGNKAANICGVLAFMHTTFTYIAEQNDLERRFKHELAVPSVAGALTGLLFTSTRSVNVIAYGTCLGTAASIAYYYGQNYYYDKLISNRRFRRRG